MLFVRFITIVTLFLICVSLPKQLFAATTLYRSAGWVETDGNPAYGNTDGCRMSDGIYCSRLPGQGGANLYFSSFGTLADFGMPANATVTAVHLRIQGKNTDTQRIYLDRGRNKKPLSQLCQNPFDLWQVYLGATNSTKEFSTIFTPFVTGGNNLGNCFIPEIIESQNYTFSIYDGESFPWSADIDNFEIAFDYTPLPSPTPTNTPTPTTIPTPVPFLDLPWKYKGNFEDSALKMNSFFDHEYPLLSSGLNEPGNSFIDLMNFNGLRTQASYSSHDGYDYGRQANVNLGDPVLAAAAGLATYIDSCKDCGNMIVIDHGNGYQTRYLHLQKDALITTNGSIPVEVKAGEIIGKVGATGNVSPKGDAGAHIHFGVVEDKNKDGNFDDNIPDGLTDPYGWQSTDPDPWEHYTFSYGGQQRTGNKSYYLWTKKIPHLNVALPANGGIFNVGKYQIEFSHDSTRPDLNLDMQLSPQANASSSLVGISPSISVVATNALGDLEKIFSESITIKIDFHDVDLSHFNLGTTTFSIYSSEDGQQWIKEPTVIDLTNKTATTHVNHLTQFALMGERLDTSAPTTTSTLAGERGQDKWFRSDVEVLLTGQDNEGGLGVNYIEYKSDDEDWQIYTNPIIFTTEGHHILSFYSVDNDGNIEDLKTVEFDIDKTPPEAKITYDLETQDLLLTGEDSTSSTSVTTTDVKNKQEEIILSDKAGNALLLNIRDRDHGNKAKLNLISLHYNNNPLIAFGDNRFVVTYDFDTKTNKIKQFDQEWLVKGESKILLEYSSKNNTTTITTKTVGEKKNKTIITGIKLLQLHTQNGTLDVRY